MNTFSLSWSPGFGSAYVMYGGARINRRAGFVRRREDGRWAAHPWPTQAVAPVPVSYHPTFEAAANRVADEYERPRPTRAPIEKLWPKGIPQQ